MKNLLIGALITCFSLTLAQTPVTGPLVSLELPLVDLLDHLGVRAWRFGVTTLPGKTLNVELIYHQRNGEGNFDPNLQTNLGQTATADYNELGPQIVSVLTSPDPDGTRVTIKMNDSVSYSSVVATDLLFLEAKVGGRSKTCLTPNKCEYILLAHFKQPETTGAPDSAAIPVDDMLSYVSLKITVE